MLGRPRKQDLAKRLALSPALAGSTFAPGAQGRLQEHMPRHRTSAQKVSLLPSCAIMLLHPRARSPRGKGELDEEAIASGRPSDRFLSCRAGSSAGVGDTAAVVARMCLLHHVFRGHLLGQLWCRLYVKPDGSAMYVLAGVQQLCRLGCGDRPQPEWCTERLPIITADPGPELHDLRRYPQLVLGQLRCLLYGTPRYFSVHVLAGLFLLCRLGSSHRLWAERAHHSQPRGELTTERSAGSNAPRVGVGISTRVEGDLVQPRAGSAVRTASVKSSPRRSSELRWEVGWLRGDGLRSRGRFGRRRGEPTGDFIDSLESLALQTLRDFEVVVVDMSQGGIEAALARVTPRLPGSAGSSGTTWTSDVPTVCN